MRAVLGQIVLDFPTNYAQNADEYLAKAGQVHEAFPIESRDLISSSIAPHAPYTVSDATLAKVNEISKTRRWPIHIHLHETEGECRDSLDQNHTSSAKHQSEEACHPIQVRILV